MHQFITIFLIRNHHDIEHNFTMMAVITPGLQERGDAILSCAHLHMHVRKL